MALPRQVQEQIRQVEELERQLQAEPEKAPPPVEESEVPETSTVEATENPATAPEVKPDQPEAQPDPESWEQKYRTLKGMFDAEVPRLHTQVKELTSALKEYQEYVKQVQEAKPEPPEKGKQPLVTDKDVEAFGEDIIDLQRRVAKEVAAQYSERLEALEAQNKALMDRLTATGEQVQTVSFEQRLTLAIPDFWQVDADPAWVAWLNDIDPILRAPRRAVAMKAFESQDVEGVKYYVDMFKATRAPAKDDRQAELQRQVSPSRTASATAAPASKKVYSAAEAADMFNRIAELGRKGRMDEAAKLDAEISAAYLEGRVRN
jgi:hypothetical protein